MSRDNDKFTCAKCESDDVEVCLPAWFNPNKELRLVECVADGDELSVYCNNCGDTTALISPNGQRITGRWQ